MGLNYENIYLFKKSNNAIYFLCKKLEQNDSPYLHIFLFFASIYLYSFFYFIILIQHYLFSSSCRVIQQNKNNYQKKRENKLFRTVLSNAFFLLIWKTKITMTWICFKNEVSSWWKVWVFISEKYRPRILERWCEEILHGNIFSASEFKAMFCVSKEQFFVLNDNFKDSDILEKISGYASKGTTKIHILVLLKFLSSMERTTLQWRMLVFPTSNLAQFTTTLVECYECS